MIQRIEVTQGGRTHTFHGHDIGRSRSPLAGLLEMNGATTVIRIEVPPGVDIERHLLNLRRHEQQLTSAQLAQLKLAITDHCFVISDQARELLRTRHLDQVWIVCSHTRDDLATFLHTDKAMLDEIEAALAAVDLWLGMTQLDKHREELIATQAAA